MSCWDRVLTPHPSIFGLSAASCRRWLLGKLYFQVRSLNCFIWRGWCCWSKKLKSAFSLRPVTSQFICGVDLSCREGRARSAAENISNTWHTIRSLMAHPSLIYRMEKSIPALSVALFCWCDHGRMRGGCRTLPVDAHVPSRNAYQCSTGIANGILWWRGTARCCSIAIHLLYPADKDKSIHQ